MQSPARLSAVGLIPVRAFAGRKAPDIFRIGFKAAPLIQTKFPVYQRGRPGIFKIIRKAIILIFKIQPHGRILMREKRRTRDQNMRTVNTYGLSDFFPAFSRNGVRGRPRRKHIQNKRFAVMIPSRPQKTLPRVPTHSQGFAPIQHPFKIHAVINLGRQTLHFRALEIFAGQKRAREKKRGINGRKLGVVDFTPRVPADKMIKKTVFMPHLVQKKPKGFGAIGLGLGFGYPAPLRSDAHGR